MLHHYFISIAMYEVIIFYVYLHSMHYNGLNTVLRNRYVRHIPLFERS